ncbi:MAG: hypothetical protein Q8Q37_01635 [bacterium]|nr:hypothetical protein [bacterium]
MNKTITALVIIIILVGGYFLLNNNQQSAPISENSLEGLPVDTSLKILYTDAGYEPNELRVTVGASVVFENQSSLSMWTASAAHPTHRVYPTAGGCIGSTFDSCAGIQPGQSWSFIFDQIGIWGYHNHLRPNYTGTIIVE